MNSRRKISADEQANRFRAMAKELECDPDEAAFKVKLAVIAKAKVAVTIASAKGKQPPEAKGWD